MFARHGWRRNLPAWAAFLMVVGAVSLWTGCGNEKTTAPTEQLAPPTNLKVFNFTDEIDLSWTASTSSGNGDFKGYNVYRSTASLADSAVSTWERHRLNRSGSVTTEATQYVDDHTTPEGGPQPNTKYYYMVVAAQGSDLSQPVSIDVAVREENANVVLAELRYSARASALEMATQDTLSMNYNFVDRIDLYLGTTDPGDAKTAPLAIKSPSLVQSPNDWSARTTGFFDITALAAGDQWKVPDNVTWTNQIIVTNPVQSTLQVIAVRTPGVTVGGVTHYHYGKLKITQVGSSAGGRLVTMTVDYQPIQDYPRFTRGR